MQCSREDGVDISDGRHGVWCGRRRGAVVAHCVDNRLLQLHWYELILRSLQWKTNRTNFRCNSTGWCVVRLPMSWWRRWANWRLMLTNGVATTATLVLLQHHFSSLFSRTTWVSRYQRGKSSLDLNEAREMGFRDGSGISWTTCKQSAPRSRQITSPTPHHSISAGRVLFLTPNQHCPSTEGI